MQLIYETLHRVQIESAVDFLKYIIVQDRIKQFPRPKFQTCLLNIWMFWLPTPGKEKYDDPYVYAHF